ncbi:DUF4386 domain-containing protein [Alloacidobacterium sp.]|uniref:DUF4386 domain-containing protein n=1 Tax=Alloacidobacterium sp. TaxID=2951999 RepID=UPI002D56228D|nr:DUF4386 domain-containing protein [Alloacidobacterium sp.]HYK34655.1 DUF4386 domain-containing protein [Alloacidobacterium sp.]
MTESPHLKARIAGFFYLLTILTGMLAVFIRSRAVGDAFNLAATACYVVVTLILYQIFKPVDRNVSLIAAFFSLAGCTLGALQAFHFAPLHINSLVFFGFYCLLIGYLILKSNFLPRVVGILMVLAGLGWLTFLSPQLANRLSPWTMLLGLLGEGSLTAWLLGKGVNTERWEQRPRRQKTLEA